LLDSEPDLEAMKTLLRSHMTKNNTINHTFRDMIYGEIGTLGPAELAAKSLSCFELEKDYEKEISIFCD